MNTRLNTFLNVAFLKEKIFWIKSNKQWNFSKELTFLDKNPAFMISFSINSQYIFREFGSKFNSSFNKNTKKSRNSRLL